MKNQPTTENINAISLENSRPQGSGPEGHQASLMTNESSFTKTEGTTVTDTATARTEGILSGAIKTKGMVDETTTLVEMLGRMCLLERGDVPLTALAGTVLSTFSFPGDILSNRFMSDKISHFYAIHTDIEVSVKIAVAPTVTVSVAMVLHPHGTPVTGLQRTSYYPHVLLVGPDVKEGTISVPFFNEEEAYQIGGKNVWDVSLVLITPVKSQAITTPISYNAYGRMKSPRLMINVAETYLSAQAQADFATVVDDCCLQSTDSDEVISKLKKAGVDIHKEAFLLPYIDRYFQQKPRQQGETADKTGTISQVASSVGSFAESIMPFVSAIPVVGEIAPAVPWIARAIAGTAGFFGFSRGVNMETTRFVSPVAGNQLTQIDGIDNSVTLGLFQDNQIDITQFPLFKGGDEMCFEALFSRKFIREVIDLEGDFFNRISLDWVNDSTSTNIMDSFSLRRYEIRNEFRLVKNAMISGKILILYDYNNSLTSVGQALQAVDSLTSKIIDVTTTSSFLFNIPWTSLSPYQGSTPGSIVMVPFNEFQTSAGGSDSISLIRYVSYANVELGRPGNMLPFQLEDAVQQSYRSPLSNVGADGRKRTTSSEFVVVRQGEDPPCDGNMHTIPAEELPMLKYKPSSMVDQCIGEMVVSTRALLKRFTIAFSAPLQYRSTTLVVRESTQLRDTLFHRFNSMWMARTGSIRMKVVVPPNMNLEVELQDHHDKYTGSSGAPFQFFSGSMNSMAEFTIPYYGKNRRSFDEYPWAPVRLSFTKQYELPGIQSTSVYVAAGDDYSGTFVKGKLPATEELLFTGLSDGLAVNPIACKHLRWIDRSGVLSLEYVPPNWGETDVIVYWTSLWKTDELSILGNLGWFNPLTPTGDGFLAAYSLGASPATGNLDYVECHEGNSNWKHRIPAAGGLGREDFKNSFLWRARPSQRVLPPLYSPPDPSYDTYWNMTSIGYLVSVEPFVLEFGRASGGRGYPIYCIEGGYYTWGTGTPVPVRDPTSFNQTVNVCLIIYEEPAQRWVKINRDRTFADAVFGSIPLDKVGHNGLYQPSFLNSKGKEFPVFPDFWKEPLTLT